MTAAGSGVGEAREAMTGSTPAGWVGRGVEPFISVGTRLSLHPTGTRRSPTKPSNARDDVAYTGAQARASSPWR